ncbi:PREDICTED: uncharacterized protein LOC105592994 isoform X15 [Cercocebus atys]|nr:PREDICTED: uncharacterized protein LOC105592994 isoform X15 [Cercocebus atys]XP_011931120.1 PREDICTED: uncharacterized protein LOC105592994 isoform X15 [Cercocebus atys]XP_011931121.1 PREDICTED: uncharacterized protein LOC105592994 isoform X15 [Cercocebus atys]XP_011931122.1 PREDICTED: uncharacterized protein LOC105592994 isoform X15 [Cercocebus atys]
MLNLEEDLHWIQWPWANVCQSSAQPQCTEDGALPDALVSCIELCELLCPADPLALTGIDGDPGGRIALGLLALTQCPSAGCSAPEKLKLWPFLVPWSPARSCVSSSAQVGQLTLTRIDGEPEGRLMSGRMDPGKRPSARCSAPGSLKLRPFLVPWSPALTCVNSSAKGWPPGIDQHSELFCPGGLPGIDGHRSSTQEVPLALTGIVSSSAKGVLLTLTNIVSFSTQVGPLALTDIVSSSTQEDPLALTGIDGGTGGRLALDLLFLGQWPLARCPVPDALKLRSFMAHWSPALSCGEHIWVLLESCVSELFCPGGAMALSGIVSFSSQAGPLALTGIVSSSAQVGPMALSGIDGKPGGRVVLGPHRPQASVLQPGAHPPGVLKLRPSLAPWSPAELCELFLPGGPPGIDWHSELFHPAGPLALTGIVLREMHHPINESRVTAFITHTFKIDRWASDDSLLRLLCLLI